MPRAHKLYPLFIDLSRLRVLIVGAGAVAKRKFQGLPRGARVTVVAPDGKGFRGARLLRRAVRLSDVDEADLVFTATNDNALNARLSRRALARGKLVCAAHDARQGNAQVPALLRAGAFRIAISSGGRGPAASKFLKAWLSEKLTPQVLKRAASKLRQWSRP